MRVSTPGTLFARIVGVTPASPRSSGRIPCGFSRWRGSSGRGVHLSWALEVPRPTIAPHTSSGDGAAPPRRRSWDCRRGVLMYRVLFARPPADVGPLCRHASAARCLATVLRFARSVVGVARRSSRSACWHADFSGKASSASRWPRRSSTSSDRGRGASLQARRPRPGRVHLLVVVLLALVPMRLEGVAPATTFNREEISRDERRSTVAPTWSRGRCSSRPASIGSCRPICAWFSAAGRHAIRPDAVPPAGRLTSAAAK